MTKKLIKSLQTTFRKLTGQATITASNIKEAIHEIQLSLIEADVHYDVAKEITQSIESIAIGQKVADDLSPSETLIAITHQEICKALGENDDASIKVNTSGLTPILLAGLQAAGKTTFAAKLAKHLSSQNKRVMLASTDIYRPAAMEQLAGLAKKANIDYWQAESKGIAATEIAKQAHSHALKHHYDILILDTAGRTTTHDTKMSEITAIQKAIKPLETLLVIDAMSGQDAAVTSKEFLGAISITGVILTKTDAESRTGAVLSARHITGKPIKFISKGEDLDSIDKFSAKTFADQILDRGDLDTLIKSLEQHTSQEKNIELAKKIKKGGFNYDDFLGMLKTIYNLGGAQKIASMLPGAGQMSDMIDQIDESKFTQMRAIIQSMTANERQFPNLVESPSRKKRIMKGSGVSKKDIDDFQKMFKKMQTNMKKMSKKMEKISRLMKGNLGSLF